MSSLKLKHSGGNSVSIAAPSSNPASNRTLTVPSNADGTILTNSTPGCILQVINGSTTSSVSMTSATFADIGLSASITPSSSSNKILVFGNIGGIETSADNTFARGQLLRASTAIISSIDYGVGFTGDTGRWGGSSSFSILDSPSTTSAITYKIQFNNPQPSGTVTIQTNSSRSSIVLMEVAG
jgi:hypothetical protein